MILQYASIKRLSQQKIRQQLHYLSFARPMLRPARPMLPLCATHFATLRDESCDLARPILRICAIQISYVETFVCTLFG